MNPSARAARRNGSGSTPNLSATPRVNVNNSGATRAFVPGATGLGPRTNHLVNGNHGSPNLPYAPHGGGHFNDHGGYFNGHGGFFDHHFGSHLYWGGLGFGFGFYGGYGFYDSFFGFSPWWDWGFGANFYSPYFFPSFGGFSYPYFWSYQYYPRFRRFSGAYVAYSEPYVTSVYLPADGFADDPYVVDDVIVDTDWVDEEPPGAAVAPVVDGVKAGGSFAEAKAIGDDLLKKSAFKEAAEAYRQAWIHDPTQDALGRMSIALLQANDFTLSAWAMSKQVGGDTKQLLAMGSLYSDLLTGPEFSQGVRRLERYLIDNPNDEGANLLLASMYVFSGRAYSGYMILSRLDAASYEPAVTKLYLEYAQSSLKK